MLEFSQRPAILLALLALLIIVIPLKRWIHKIILLNTPLNVWEKDVIYHEIPLLKILTAKQKRKLEGKINLFLNQIDFLGCNGVEVTDHMRLLIAAQACLLIVNTKGLWYDTLRTVLIYPSAFQSTEIEDDGLIVSEYNSVRVGESWYRGPVILSWSDSKTGTYIGNDGRNVVIHEFAHQLDAQTGSTNGMPLLKKGHSSKDWESVFIQAYNKLIDDIDNENETTLDTYAATNPAEFFAVSVETFFEKPNFLKKHNPNLYNQLATFFELDPASYQLNIESNITHNLN